MGGTRFSDATWAAYSSSVASKSRDVIFTSKSVDPSLDPSKFDFRESCDSDANKNSTPIILACDETGSMGITAEEIIKRQLGTIMLGIYDRKPVTDPHIMCCAIGDGSYHNTASPEEAPIQATQFEAGVEPITAQIEKIFIEGRGGGNGGESYPLCWLLASRKTLCDSYLKRNKKGYLFTIGDECPLPIEKGEAKKYLNLDIQDTITPAQMLEEVTRKWEVFHLIVKPVSSQDPVSVWRGLLGERALVVEDLSKLGEVIIAAMQINEGHDAKKVVNSWDGSTNLVVQKAVGGLTAKASTDAIGNIVVL